MILSAQLVLISKDVVDEAINMEVNNIAAGLKPTKVHIKNLLESNSPGK